MARFSQHQAKQLSRITLAASVLAAAGAGAAWWAVPRGQPVLHDQIAQGSKDAPAIDAPDNANQEKPDTAQPIDVTQASMLLAVWDVPVPEPTPVKPDQPQTTPAKGGTLPELVGVIKERDDAGVETRYAIVRYSNGRQGFLGTSDRGDGFIVSEVGDGFMTVDISGGSKRIDRKPQRTNMLGSIIAGAGTLAASAGMSPPNGLTPQDLDEIARQQAEEAGAAFGTSAANPRAGGRQGRPNIKPSPSVVPADGSSEMSAGDNPDATAVPSEGSFSNRSRAVPTRPRGEDNR